MALFRLVNDKDTLKDYYLLFPTTELLLIVRTDVDVGESSLLLLPIGEALNFLLITSFFERELLRPFGEYFAPISVCL